MANYQTIKSDIVLNECPLVKEPKTVKVSAIPTSTSTDVTKPVCVQVHANNQTKGVKYMVLTCPTVFVQTLGKMCSGTEPVCPYEHIVLCGSNLLSKYLSEAWTKNVENKTGHIWNNGAFALIMKESFWPTCCCRRGYLLQLSATVTKNLNNMTPKAFMACFEALFKLYEELNADYDLTFGEKVILSSSTPFLLNIKTCLFNNKMITTRWQWIS